MQIEDEFAKCKRQFPRAYDDGFNKGQELYDRCVPQESICEWKSSHKNPDEAFAYQVGVMDGYSDAESNDYKTQDFKQQDDLYNYEHE